MYWRIVLAYCIGILYWCVVFVYCICVLYWCIVCLQEKRFQGDDMVRDFDKRGRKRKTVDLPSKLYSKHLSRTKAGKFRDGVLQLTNQDVRKVKFQARKKSRR